MTEVYQNRVSILLIEDNSGDVELITRMIKSNPALPAEIVHADRLSTAKTLMAERKFDIILLDLGLPDSQGFETIKKIDSSDVPIIVLTGLANEALGIEAVHSGTEDFLVKGEITGKILIKSIEYAIERHTIKKMLRLSEEKYQALAENTGDIIFSLNMAGVFTYISPQINGYGFLADEIIGKSFRTIIHPEDIDRVENELSRDLEIGAQFHSMFRVPDKWENVNWFDEKGTIRVDQYGNTIGIYGVLRDITDRKRAEEALAESESFNRGLVENLPDYIIVYGEDTEILYVNPAIVKALGYSAEKLIGTHVLLYVAEEYRNAITVKMAACRKRDDTPAYETDIITHNGLRRSVIVKGTAIQYHDTPATLILLIDITDRKALEDQLIVRSAEISKISAAFQQANKKLTLLSGITRHDINNQLTVLTGYLTILEKMQPEPTHNEYFLKAATAAQQISAMIRFTKEYEAIGVNAPLWQDCRTLVDTAAKEAPPGKVLVKNDLSAGTEIFADPLIVKVFYNLMDNAVRYGGKITTIRFFFEERDGDHIVLCEDDGDGVPAEEKERIFERGFGKNTGLGLFLSREILSITGITIRETGEPGRGARFEMTVPEGAWRMTGGGA